MKFKWDIWKEPLVKHYLYECFALLSWALKSVLQKLNPGYVTIGLIFCNYSVFQWLLLVTLSVMNVDADVIWIKPIFRLK